jgi:hypothetical protein
MYSHNANIQGVKFSWQKAVGSWTICHSANPEKYNLSFFEDARKSKQSKIACFSALPTFILNSTKY